MIFFCHKISDFTKTFTYKTAAFCSKIAIFVKLWFKKHKFSPKTCWCPVQVSWSIFFHLLSSLFWQEDVTTHSPLKPVSSQSWITFCLSVLCLWASSLYQQQSKTSKWVGSSAPLITSRLPSEKHETKVAVKRFLLCTGFGQERCRPVHAERKGKGNLCFHWLILWSDKQGTCW